MRNTKRSWKTPVLVVHGKTQEITAGGCWYGKRGGRYDADLGPSTLSDCR